MSERQSTATVLERARTSLEHAARYNPGDVIAPVVVLWTDADGQWQPLVEQLKPGGKIVIPVGSQWGVQDLMLVTQGKDGKLVKKSMLPVRFVPLVRDKE